MYTVLFQKIAFIINCRKYDALCVKKEMNLLTAVFQTGTSQMNYIWFKIDLPLLGLSDRQPYKADVYKSCELDPLLFSAFRHYS